MESSNYLFMNISLLYRNGQKYYDKKLAEYGIGSGQLPFLILIYENEGISMQNLALKGCFDKGTITKSVQKLEEQGLVTTVASEEDRRVRCLYTTEKTKEIIPEIYKIRRRWWEKLTSNMDAKEEELFEASLEKLCDTARNFEEEDTTSTISLFGLQKLTLLDYPGKMASTIFTGGCNFRCPFCQNSDLVFLPENTAEIAQEDILSFLKKRIGILEGICISGGEPLLSSGLEPFMRKVKALGYKIKLDTNGSNPSALQHLVDEGLVDFVAMDIKNSPKRYAETIGLTTFDITPIQQSIQYLLSNAVDYEFRTTIVKEFHSIEDMKEIVKWLQGADAYYLQNFVDSDHVITPGLHAHDIDTLHTFLEIIKEYIPNTQLRGI
ncbi:MAG: anaerobic ribonucleoside-triphosphate reductase activating protein [Longicatena sp.]